MSINLNGNEIANTGFTSTGYITTVPTVVTSGLVLWLDAGNNASYINSSSYYDCGYGCQYYASNPGCTNCNTQIKDMSGLGNDGTINGATISYDNTGGNMVFAQGTQRIDVSKTNLPPTNSFTLSAWAYCTNLTNDQNIISRNGPYFMRLSGAKVRFNVLAGGTWLFQAGTTTLSNNTWYNYSMTYDGASFIGYINGVQEFNVGKTGTVTSDGTLYIGYTPIGGEQSGFDGKIPIAQIYNRALNATEVLQNFNAGRQRFGI